MQFEMLIRTSGDAPNIPPPVCTPVLFCIIALSRVTLELLSAYIVPLVSFVKVANLQPLISPSNVIVPRFRCIALPFSVAVQFVMLTREPIFMVFAVKLYNAPPRLALQPVIGTLSMVMSPVVLA